MLPFFGGISDCNAHEKIPVDMLVDAGLARYRNAERPSEGVYAMFRNRLIIPIRNAQGRVVAFGGRRMPSDTSSPAKYVNSPETAIYKKSQTLFGLSFARGSIQKKERMIIVEGYFDVIALHRNGFRETIATCGTALTPEHIQILRPISRRAIALFDEDEAGVRAAEKSLPLFWEGRIEPMIITWFGEGPDEYFLDETNTPETFESLLTTAEPLFDTRFQSDDKLGISPGGVEQIIEHMLPILLNTNACTTIQYSIVGIQIGCTCQRIEARTSKTASQDAVVHQNQAVDCIHRCSTNCLACDSLSNEMFRSFGDLQNPQVLLQREATNVLTPDLEELMVFGRLLSGEQLSEIFPDLNSDHLRKSATTCCWR